MSGATSAAAPVRSGGLRDRLAWVLLACGFVVLLVGTVLLTASAQLTDKIGPFPQGRENVVALEAGTYLVFEQYDPPPGTEVTVGRVPITIVAPGGAEVTFRSVAQTPGSHVRDSPDHVRLGEFTADVAGDYRITYQGAFPLVLTTARDPRRDVALVAAGTVLVVVGVLMVSRRPRRDSDSGAPGSA